MQFEQALQLQRGSIQPSLHPDHYGARQPRHRCQRIGGNGGLANRRGFLEKLERQQQEQQRQQQLERQRQEEERKRMQQQKQQEQERLRQEQKRQQEQERQRQEQKRQQEQERQRQEQQKKQEQERRKQEQLRLQQQERQPPRVSPGIETGSRGSCFQRASATCAGKSSLPKCVKWYVNLACRTS